MTESFKDRHRRPLANVSRRRGGVTVEMIMVVVVLVLATIGIVHFGVFFANTQQVALAARVGAEEASQLGTLPDSNTDVEFEDVLNAIKHQLESSCIDYCQVRLEHNGGPLNSIVVVTSTPTMECDCVVDTSLPNPPGFAIDSTQYVRVTVCVPLSELFPVNLSFFGVQLFDAQKTYEQTAVFRYELKPPTP